MKLSLRTVHPLQLCMLSVNRDGLSLKWEDSSKGMQSSIWLHSEVRWDLAGSHPC